MISIFGNIILTKRDFELIKYELKRRHKNAAEIECRALGKQVLTKYEDRLYNLLIYLDNISKKELDIIENEIDSKYLTGYDIGYKKGYDEAINEVIAIFKTHMIYCIDFSNKKMFNEVIKILEEKVMSDENK